MRPAARSAAFPEFRGTRILPDPQFANFDDKTAIAIGDDGCTVCMLAGAMLY
jgi:hypothetical protein